MPRGAHDLQPALRAVGQAAGLFISHVLHVEDAQQLHRPLVGDALLLPVGGQAQYAAQHAVFYLVVQAQLDVVLHREVGEEADVLERPRHAQLVHLLGAHAGGVAPVHHDDAARGLIDLGEQVEHCGLARAVGADEAGYLRAGR